MRTTTSATWSDLSRLVSPEKGCQMRARTLPITVAAALLSAACAAPSQPQPRASVSAPATTVPSPMPSPSPADGRRGPVVLPRLPPQGIAIEDGTAVVFVDLEGRVVARLRGFELYYEWTVPGPVVLRRSRAEFFVLRVRSHTVRPLSRDEAFAISPQFESGFGPDADPGLPYPTGTRVEGHPELGSGFWAYALPSPDGSSLLAQWSGECEVPHAFFVDTGWAVTVDGRRRIASDRIDRAGLDARRACRRHAARRTVLEPLRSVRRLPHQRPR
jgi:hypothetical protein